MLRTFTISLVLALFSLALHAETSVHVNTGLVAPLNQLFQHQKHLGHFKDLGVSCYDCHNFSVKAKEKGPLAKPVVGSYLKPDQSICHQCHRGRLNLPRRSQCTLCHSSSHDLMPIDHNQNWMYHHGSKAQMDADSCTQCHKTNDCSDCHLGRDNMNPRVHRGNIRFTHAMEARLKPQKCAYCHKSQSFCRDCHTGKVR